VTKTKEVSPTPGGTAWMKRTQGIYQAAGEFASPLRLIQPRKQQDVEADLVTSKGRQHPSARNGEHAWIPSGSNKIVAW
jgi:hypothetical protein